MPTEGTDSSYMWRKSRMKVAMTKRSASMSDRQRKRTSSKHDDDDNNEIEDDFTSCFIDDESDNENNDSLFLQENHEEKEINDKHPKSRLYSQNGRAIQGHRLLSGSASTSSSRLPNDNQEIETLDSYELEGADKIKNAHEYESSGDAHAIEFLLSKDGKSGNQLEEDQVDMAISRDGFGDRTDLGLARGSVDQQKRKMEMAKLEIHAMSKINKQDKFEPTVKFGWLDMLMGVTSIAVFLVDIGTDIELAAHYFREERWRYGSVTAALIVVPSLITCFLGLHWYLIDYKKEKRVVEKLKKDKRKAYVIPSHVWFLRIFFTLLMCGPIVRILEYLYCGVNSRNKKLTARERRRFYRFMMYEDVDSCLLRLFESFLESAPQLTWQLYIAIELKPQEDAVGSSVRVIALLSSWGSLAISLMSYQKSLRNSHEEKAKMSLKSLPFYFIWRASEIGGRVLCIAMFASAFDLWVFGPLVFHWVFMSGWLILQKTTFYKNMCLEKVFNIICGYVMVFCFLNLREGQTRFRVILFYFILYVENFFMLALWFRFTQDLGAWFHLWGFIVVLILFVLHIVFQLVYYWFFHPTKAIKMCLPCDRYVVYSSICHDLQPREDSARGDLNQSCPNNMEIIVENKGSKIAQNTFKDSQVSMV